MPGLPVEVHRTMRVKVESGEWVQPKRRGYELQCCDCGLVHRFNFRLWNNRIQLQAFREERKTAATRRERRKRGETVSGIMIDRRGRHG